MNTEVIRKALFNATGHNHYTMHVSSRGVELHAADTTVRYDSFNDLERDAEAGLSKLVDARKRASREKYVCDINGWLWQIAKAMKELAGEDDMASVQINSSFKAILRIGPHRTEHLSITQFATAMYEALHP